MSETITLHGPTRALAALEDSFEYGRGAESLGVTDTVHAATWHMAGLIEQLYSLRADRVEELRLGAGPVRPDEEPTR